MPNPDSKQVPKSNEPVVYPRANTAGGRLLGNISLGERLSQSYFGGSLLRRFLIDYAIGTVINTLCAIMVFTIILPGESFFHCWVFSMCIGSLVMWLIDGARLLIWGGSRPNLAALIAMIVVAVPVAYFAGSYAASKILALPSETVLSHQVEHASPLLTMIVVVCLMFAWFNWNQSELAAVKAAAAAEKAHTAAIEKQAIQAQLQLLQAQIEPHMLFNTLANLQGLIAIDPPRAQYMLDQLIHYLRASLTSARAEKTTLAHEFELMQAYLELMSVRMGARLTYKLILPPELSKVTVPPMLLQPLVENAIKHGLEAKIEGGRIDVEARRDNGTLVISVTDNGLGLDDGDASHGTQVGLANVRERLHALYDGGAGFSLQANDPQGAVATIMLPATS